MRTASSTSLWAWISLQRWMLAAMAAGAVISFYGLSPPASLAAAALVVIAILIAVVDLEFLVIPDIANAALAIVGVILLLVEAAPGDRLEAVGQAAARAATAAGALALLRYAYLRFAHVEGLGLGDVKLAAAGAVILSWSSLPIALLIASAGGLFAVAGRTLRSGRALDRQAEIPFGAFLAPAIWIAFMLERSGAVSF